MFKIQSADWRRRHQTLLGCLLVTVLSGLIFFHQLGAKDIWGRAEAASPVTARHMLESSRYIIPELSSHTFIDNRPPGYYWLAALAFKLKGDTSQRTARIPAALAAFFCVLAVYAFGCQVGGPRVGLWASITLLGTAKFVLQGRAAEQDMVLALLTTLCFWVFWFWREPGKIAARSTMERFGWAALLQVLVGLAAMIKGPAIGLTFIIPAAVYVTAARQWKQIDFMMLIVTSPIAIALALWWYAYIWFAMPHEHAQLLYRFLNQSNVHVRGWYYYLIKLPMILGPVAVFLPLLWFNWRESSGQERSGVLGYWLVWLLGNIFIFSLFPSKQSHYLVPAFPGLALALGLALAHPSALTRYFHLGFVWLIMAVMLLLPIGGVIMVDQGWLVDPHPLVKWALVTACAGVALFLGIKVVASKTGVAVGWAWGFWLLALVAVLGYVLPLLDTSQSARGFAKRVNLTVPGDARIGMFSADPTVDVYLSAPVVGLADAAEARAFLRASTANYLIAYSGEIERKFSSCQLNGIVEILEQEDFTKKGVTVYLLDDLEGHRCDED